jgi:hypothetical protein
MLQRYLLRKLYIKAGKIFRTRRMRVLLPIILLASHMGLFVLGATIVPPREEIAVLAQETMNEAKTVQKSGDYWQEVFFYYKKNIVAIPIIAIPDMGAFISHMVMVNTGGAVQAIAPNATLCKEMNVTGTDCHVVLSLYILNAPHAWLEIGAISIVAAGSMMFLGLGYPPERVRNKEATSIRNIHTLKFWKEALYDTAFAYKSGFYFFIPWKWSTEDKAIAKKELKYLLYVGLIAFGLFFGAAMVEAFITA